MKRFISSRWLSLLIVPVMLVGMLAVAVQPVYAAEIINNGNIGPTQVINDDVVISGQDPVIDGQVNGVVVAAGQTVTIMARLQGMSSPLGGR
jgi:hypothetical protein